jgi:C-terminal processing protease CtpA/Prc
VTAPSAKRVVFDLRNNTGGEVRALDPFVELFSDPDVQQPNRLFVVTGRNTFSAASMLVARLQADAQAVVVGEPMSGCPTTWGNNRTFNLPSSHIDVDVSSQLEVGVSETDSRSTIEPDIPAPLSEADWMAHKDPALAAIAEFLSRQ